MAAPSLAEGLLFSYVPFLLSTTVHEASHALSAKLLGDDTAYRGGQVTLNPVPHMKREPFGMVALPLILLFTSGYIMGWASAPVDAFWAARNPRRAAVVSMAGPIANFVLAAIAFFVLRILVHSDLDMSEGNGRAIKFITLSFLYLNVILGIFNLIPLPPLDGAGVLEGFFPRTLGNFYALLRTQPMIMLVIAFTIMRYGSGLYVPVLEWLNKFL